MPEKKALITGVTGQDGSCLADFLIQKGYEVHGMQRRSSIDNTGRIQDCKGLHLHYGDLTDSSSIFKLMHEIQPDEVYNLAAQSDVAVSFENPEFSANVNALGTLRLLEAIRTLKLTKKTRFYQASTSELFGQVQEVPQKETTPFYPCSPYAVSKMYAYWITINYRESYGMYACNGILFNHESAKRGEGFVTRKITRALGKIACGLQKNLHLGNLNALRDWGHSRDFIEMQWHILQQDKAEDYVIATGEQHSVREFATIAAAEIGIKIRWEGSLMEEKGIVEALDPSYNHALKVGDEIIQVDPQFFRPHDVETLLGDPSKAFKNLGWKPKISFQELVSEMALSDYALAQNEKKTAQV